jgi:hypothetical protein
MLVALSGGLLGLVSGVRHAMEPDHLAAVSTFVAEQKSPRQSVNFAMAWGAGHALMLVAVGGGFVLLGREMPAAVADGFELAVAAMLIGLGVRSLVAAWRARRPGGAPAPAHSHAARVRRPLLVGIVHGLSGSGALTAMVLARLASPLAGIAFMAIYGIGAMLGMAAIAGVAGVPLSRIVRSPHGLTAMMAVAGIVSLVVGASWGAPLALRIL